jgi:hypothetical protein
MLFLQTRHKRNATFPGGKSTTMIHQPPRIVAATEKSHMSTRPRFNSCHTDPGCRVSANNETLATPLNTDVFTPQPTLLTPGKKKCLTTLHFFFAQTRDACLYLSASAVCAPAHSTHLKSNMINKILFQIILRSGHL